MVKYHKHHHRVGDVSDSKFGQYFQTTVVMYIPFEYLTGVSAQNLYPVIGFSQHAPVYYYRNGTGTNLVSPYTIPQVAFQCAQYQKGVVSKFSVVYSYNSSQLGACTLPFQTSHYVGRIATATSSSDAIVDNQAMISAMA